MGGSFLSTSGSFSMGGGRRLLQSDGNATAENTQTVIETLLELGSMIEDHSATYVKKQVMKRSKQKCVDSLQTIKMVMGDDVSPPSPFSLCLVLLLNLRSETLSHHSFVGARWLRG